MLLTKSNQEISKIQMDPIARLHRDLSRQIDSAPAPAPTQVSEVLVSPAHVGLAMRGLGGGEFC